MQRVTPRMVQSSSNTVLFYKFSSVSCSKGMLLRTHARVRARAL